jgi:hypothetical protein
MKPTPIKWILEQLKVCNYISKKGYKNAETWLIQEALEYEQEQQDEFAIGFVEWKDKISTSDLMYSSKYAKTNYELLEIYKKEQGL